MVQFSVVFRLVGRCDLSVVVRGCWLLRGCRYARCVCVCGVLGVGCIVWCIPVRCGGVLWCSR